MTTKSWTRLYRPNDLDSYVGNLPIKRKVESMFKNGRVPQTILLEGDRGCGKTTLARIMAKNLMCKNPLKNGLACEMCDSCVKLNEKFIATGESPSGMTVYEVDITKANSIEDANKIVEQMRIRPMGKTKKVFILDEIQRASKQAQNSFLKVTEEPGDYLYIILCTTNPEDLIEPFKSRFNSLKVRRPAVQDIVDRLKYICESENVKYDEASLRLIASQCNRVPRESINKLEMIALNGEVSYDNTLEELQMVRVGLYHEYVDLLGKDIFLAMQFIEDLYEEHGIDWGDFLTQLADYIMDVFNLKLGIRLEKYTEDEYKSARKILKRYTAKDLARLLGLIKEAMKIKENPRYALTMLTLEMGYPSYLESPKQDGIQSELKKETTEGKVAYVKKKDEFKRKMENNLDKVEEMTPDDLMNMLPGVEMVDISFLENEENEENEEKEEKEENE
jgi:DNA polymerase-3 subunit gamma/tau